MQSIFLDVIRHFDVMTSLSKELVSNFWRVASGALGCHMSRLRLKCGKWGFVGQK